MAKYKLGGQIYEAESEAEARRMHAEFKTAASAPPPVEEPKHPIGTAVVRNSADFLNSFIDRSKTTGRKAVNLALPKSLEPKWATDEAIKADEKATAPQTGAGKFGSFASDWAGGTFLGAGPELGMAKVGMAALPRAGALLQGAGRVAANATAGGLQGALLASPDERGTGAAVGAVSSGVLGTAGELGRSGLRVLGKNRTAPEAAKVLTELKSVDPDAFIPASHSLKPGLLRSIYEGVVSNAPGSGGKFRKQHADAVQAGYRRLINEAMPVGTPLDTVMPKGGTVHEAMFQLNPKSGSGGAWDRALGKYNQELFDASNFQLPQHVQEGLDALHLPSSISDDMTGQQLITMRDDLQRVRDQIVAKKAGGDEKLGRQLVKSYDDAREEILEIMKRKYLDPNGQPLPGMSDYLDDLKNYKNYDTLRTAVGATSTGEPGFGSIAMAAQRKSPEAGVMGQAGPLQTLGNDFSATLGDFPSKQGVFQMAAAQGSSAGVANALLPGKGSGGMLPQALAFAANPVLGTKTVQKGILEGSSTARRMEAFLKKYPQFGRAVRSGAISAFQESE